MKRALPSQIILCVVLVSLPVFIIPAQLEVTAPPRVAVLTPINESGQAQYDALALTMAGTIDFTLRLVGDYRVRRLRDHDIASGSLQQVSVSDTAAAARLAVDEDLDYLVLGRLDSTEQGGILFEIAVWDRAEDSYSIRLEAIAESLFDTFDVADELTVEILSAMTGRRIAFGAIAVEPEPVALGSADSGVHAGTDGGAGVPGDTGPDAFLVFIDGQYTGQYTGQSRARVENVPAGERRVEILPLTDDPRGTLRHIQTVVLPPDETVTVRYPAAVVTHPWFVPRLVAFEEPDTESRNPSPSAAVATAERATAAAGASSRPSSRPFPEWLELGFNRDRGLWRSAVVREIVGSDWFHQPARWESNAARYPMVNWRIDGTLDEWPPGTMVYRIDPDREPGAFVRVSELGLAYAPNAIYLFVLLDGDWERFLRNSEPAIYLGATVTGEGPSRLRYVVRRESRRWRVEGRENRTPYSEYPFQALRGGRAATDGPVVEARIPLDLFDHIREMEITDISLEHQRGNDFEEVFRIRNLGTPEVR